MILQRIARQSVVCIARSRYLSEVRNVSQGSPRQSTHLNSLGYVIQGSRSRAMIAWGLDASGTRVSIADARRGGAQELLCECGDPLVAKKGDIKVHHFAHKAGGARHCEAAAAAAKVTFISDALLDAGEIALPVTGGLLSHAKILAVAPSLVEGHQVHIVDAQRGRKLVVFARLRRHEVQAVKDWCRSERTSGIIVDLTAYRHGSDQEIRLALQGTAPRVWLFRSTDNDHQARPEVLRHIYLRGP